MVPRYLVSGVTRLRPPTTVRLSGYKAVLSEEKTGILTMLGFSFLPSPRWTNFRRALPFASLGTTNNFLSGITSACHPLEHWSESMSNASHVRQRCLRVSPVSSLLFHSRNALRHISGIASVPRISLELKSASHHVTANNVTWRAHSSSPRCLPILAVHRRF